jgi:hypothetical protein
VGWNELTVGWYPEYTETELAIGLSPTKLKWTYIMRDLQQLNKIFKRSSAVTFLITLNGAIFFIVIIIIIIEDVGKRL